MEKNCTNCKYHLPVSGNFYSGQYSGICNHKEHLGILANKYTTCSEYEVQEDLTYTKEEIQDVLLGVKCCTDPKSKGCSECPFARYKCTCQQDLMFAAGAAIEKLQRELGGYIVDQGIWLTKNNALEKEIEELKEQKAYYWEKADTLEENYESLKRDTDRLEFRLSEVLRLNAQLTEDNKERCDEYHRGYRAGYEYGKQDALTADRAEPSKERPEVEG